MSHPLLLSITICLPSETQSHRPKLVPTWLVLTPFFCFVLVRPSQSKSRSNPHHSLDSSHIIHMSARSTEQSPPAPALDDDDDEEKMNLPRRASLAGPSSECFA